MIISRLYIKYFAAVMAIIILSHILILGLFGMVLSSTKHHEHDDRFLGTAYILRDHIREKIEDNGSKNLNLDETVLRSAAPPHTNIWVCDARNTVIAKGNDTFSDLPEFPRNMKNVAGFEMLLDRENDRFSFIKIPITTQRGQFTVFVRTERPPLFMGNPRFLQGLGLVTILVALLLFPLMRQITVPLRKLTESAHAISRGEFNRKVNESRGDEIGELAHAFNVMSEKVLLMIRGTKELTANISHQIRSPLARISVAAEILREQSAKQDIKGIQKTISTIEQEITNLDRLTGRLIDLIRNENLATTKISSFLDLAEEGENASLRYSEMMHKKKTAFTKNITGTNIIMGDDHSIQELFDILFENAVKYCPSGGNISLDIFAKGGCSRIILSNTAPPCDGKMLSEIFKPFVRNESERIPGFGLGLAIASHIVKNHHGAIHAENFEKGIRFIIDFPSVIPDTV